jgi:hypothetical protein
MRRSRNIVVIIENLDCPRHTFLSSCRNPKFAACFYRTGILSAFLFWDVLILAIVVVNATFGTNSCSLNSSRTVTFNCVTIREYMLLQDSFDSIKVLTVVVVERRRWSKWAMFC